MVSVLREQSASVGAEGEIARYSLLFISRYNSIKKVSMFSNIAADTYSASSTTNCIRILLLYAACMKSHVVAFPLNLDFQIVA